MDCLRAQGLPNKFRHPLVWIAQVKHPPRPASAEQLRLWPEGSCEADASVKCPQSPIEASTQIQGPMPVAINFSGWQRSPRSTRPRHPNLNSEQLQETCLPPEAIDGNQSQRCFTLVLTRRTTAHICLAKTLSNPTAAILQHGQKPRDSHYQAMVPGYFELSQRLHASVAR